MPEPTKLEMTILSLLHPRAKMYGLEMVRAAGGILKRGTVYVYLDRMEKKGWIQSEALKDPTASGMPRRLYWLTESGRHVHDHGISITGGFSVLDGNTEAAPA